MKELVIISGKGGTGKTSITASLSVLAGQQAIIADCDVDAADMHLLLEPNNDYSEDFYSGVIANIDSEKCINCGKCKEVCHFKAVKAEQNNHEVIDLNCEGCGYCSVICPTQAIKMVEQNVGKWYSSDIKTGSKMVHARLKSGADNSGKLVAKVKNQAKELATKLNKDYIIVDGSPGIGCPVVSSLSGADYVLFVTEPTVSGIHDLQRVHQLVIKFGIRSGCIINKADLNSELSSEIISYLDKNNIDHLGNIPYDESFTKAMTDGKSIVEIPDSLPAKIIKGSWLTIQEKLEIK